MRVGFRPLAFQVPFLPAQVHSGRKGLMGQDGVTRRWEPEAKVPKRPGPDTSIRSQHPEPPWSSPQPGHSFYPPTGWAN